MQINNANDIAANTAQAQSNAGLLVQNIVYTANVGGKAYTADLSLSAGEYVATIPELPTISASGTNLLVAENNLGAHIRLQA